MQINVEFRERNAEWEQYVRESAATAARILQSPAFLERVRTAAPFTQTDRSPAEIAELLQKAQTLTLHVGFYWRPLGPSIAKEVDGAVLFNTAARRRGAGSPGNIAHELMHVLGFTHDGNRPDGNEATVPWRIGQWVDEMTDA